MTLRLKEIRERLEKATPGPWQMANHRGAVNVYRIDNDMTANEAMRSFEANRQFIESAPSDIAWLIEQIEKCQKDRDEWKAHFDARAGIHENLIDDMKQIQSENDRLRAALELAKEQRNAALHAFNSIAWPTMAQLQDKAIKKILEGEG